MFRILCRVVFQLTAYSNRVYVIQAQWNSHSENTMTAFASNADFPAVGYGKVLDPLP